ncbi:MAG: S8 family serine peptidase [Planctomycetota bacterium]|jgi:subtilisin
MKTKTLMTILAGMLVLSFVSTALAIPADNNPGGPERVRVLIGFRNVPGPSEQALVRSHGGTVKYSYRLVPGIAASIPQTAINGLSRNPKVTMIEDDLTVYAIDAELDNSLEVKHIGAGTVHGNGNKGTGVKVAIIDSGIDYNHEDLNANYAGGYDFVNSDADPMDDLGHGTHVAGTVAAEDDGSGVVGVAPEAQIYGLKVLSASGSGSYSNVIAALEWAIVNGIPVTNNSYGSSGYPGLLVELTFDLAEDVGIINVCAAGNSGNSAGTGENMIYPSRFASCIAVAATRSNDVRADFSSTGQQMEIAAPGSWIYSTYPGDRYVYMSGTSMACPHVAGVVALMINASVSDVRGSLATTADDLGDPGWDPQYGYGLVNAVAAVAGQDEFDPVDDPPSVEITDPSDDETISGSSVTVTADASDDYGVAQVEFFVDGVSIGVDTTAPYSIKWDITFVDYDSYTITATATDTVSQIKTDSVTVTIDNLDEPPTATIIHPDDSSTVSGIVTIQVDATDAEDAEGDLTVEVSLDSGGWALASYNLASGYYELGWDTTGLTDETPHTIDARTTDNGANITNATQVTVTVDNPTPSISMHVHSITVTTVKADKGRKRGRAVVVIVDSFGSPISNAIVVGMFLGDINEQGLALTGSSGMAEFLTGGTAKGRCHLTFCVDVDGVSHSVIEYNSGDNVETCDSNY